MPAPPGEWPSDSALGEGEAGPGPADPPAADALRSRILRRFEAWLDEVLADEPPPDGLDAELLAALRDEAPRDDWHAESGAGCDLYTLWSALIGVTEETRLQGRAFKQLHDTLAPLGPLPESIQQVLSASDAAASAARDATSQACEEARRQARSDLLDVLLDVRERLLRGADAARQNLDAVQEKGPTWVGRLFGRGARAARPGGEGVAALLEGYTMGLDRLNEALASMGVSEIPCAGRPFDPGQMSAVDVEQTADVPDGTVVEVYRRGYAWRGRVHRPAQVKVARQAGGGSPGGQEQREQHHG